MGKKIEKIVNQLPSPSAYKEKGTELKLREVGCRRMLRIIR